MSLPVGARALGMPALRELVLVNHAMLYAHGEHEVALLFLRHDQQLGYQLTRTRD